MEILQLKYFCDAAQTQNFSKTAERFMVPPSSVSQSIKRLEKELGYSLFVRNTNRIFLSRQGRIFYEAVKQSAEIIEKAKKKIADKEDEISGEIRLHIYCNRRIVAEAIKQFKKQYPKVSFILNHGFPSDERFDIVITDEERHDDKFEKKSLITEDIAIAFSKRHPLAEKESISLHDIAGEHFITMQKGSRLYTLTQKICQSAGIVPKVTIQCDDPFYMRKYIEMELGVGFVPLFSWDGLISDDIVCKRIEGIARTTYVYYDAEGYVTNAVKMFLELLYSLCRKRNIDNATKE